MLALAALFRRDGPADRAKDQARLLPSHLAAMQAIAPCRTATLGGHLSPCPACGALEDRSHACTHRHGPTCQKTEATQWLEKQRERLLPVAYFLVTFTVPEDLRALARAHQTLLYTLLFQTSAAALQARALDPLYRCVRAPNRR